MPGENKSNPMAGIRKKVVWNKLYKSAGVFKEIPLTPAVILGLITDLSPYYHFNHLKRVKFTRCLC